MPQITIRNIEDEVYRRLKKRARASRRSLEAEVGAMVHQAAVPDGTDAARRAAALRARLTGRYKGDATADIRGDRER